MEIFKQIPSHPNYEVSDLGNVRSTRRNKLLKPDTLNGAYKRVSLSSKGVVTRIFIHRLVADAFIPNPLKKPFVNHIDNDPTNNCVSNLEWVTHSENMLHCANQGRDTHSLAAQTCVANKRNAIINKIKAKVGDANFIAYNAVAGGKASVTLLCVTCQTQHTVRTDSSALKKENVECRACAYKSR